MNVSTDTMENNLHFPLKVEDLPDGQTKITCSVTPEKEWIGPSLSTTLRVVQNDLRTMQEKREINQLPKCFTDGTFSGTIVR